MTDSFKCEVCLGFNGIEEVTKQRCGHIICWKCLSDYINPRIALKIKCPIKKCPKFLSDGAIRKVLSDTDTDKYEQLMLTKLQQKIKCLLPECNYIFICAENEIQFECPECSLFNCVSCKSTHRFLSCKEYKRNENAGLLCEEEIRKAKKNLRIKKRNRNRLILEEIDNTDLFIYDKLLECPNCMRHLSRGDGVLLRCSHLCCRFCLENHIKSSFKIPILCPTECKMPLNEREILGLISKEDLKIYIDRCNSAVIGKLEFTFHCQTQDCCYIVEYTVKPDKVYCPLCKVSNCTKCYAIHENETCEHFKNRIKDTKLGKNLLDIEDKISKKELMRCLKCHQVLKKTSGCNWIQCSNCKFEMCWALQIRRWGPKGRGDTSDGCKCGLRGVLCAPNCYSCQPHASL